VSSWALALAFAGSPSRVAIGLDPPREPGLGVTASLCGWLVTQLLDEGAVVIPEDRQPDSIVRLRASSLGVEVTVDGTISLVEQGPTAIMQLELLHRVSPVVRDRNRAAGFEDEPAVAVWVLGQEEGDVQDLVRWRLLRAGFALRSTPRERDVLVCVNQGPDGTSASLGKPGHRCEPPPLPLDPNDLESDLAPLLDAIRSEFSVAAGSVQTRPRRAAANSFPRPIEAPHDSPPLRLRRNDARRSNAAFDLGVDGGVAWRGQAVPAVNVFTRLGRIHGPGGLLQVGLSPWVVSDHVVVELELTAGPDLSLRAASQWVFDAAILLGAQLRSRSYREHWSTDSTWRVSVPIKVGRQLTRSLRAYLVSEFSVVGFKPDSLIPEIDRRQTHWGVRLGLGLNYGWMIP